MSLVYRSGPEEDAVVVDLRDPKIAALLAWLWPGAGHFYQRRFTKGFLFMICILGTFFYGLGMGRGRVVYASFRDNDFRWQYICQAGVGAPSFLAVVQSYKVKNGGDPFFVLCERYPAGSLDENFEPREFEIIPASERAQYTGETIKDGLMAPPKGPVFLEKNDVLWHVACRNAALFRSGDFVCNCGRVTKYLSYLRCLCRTRPLSGRKRNRTTTNHPASRARPRQTREGTNDAFDQFNMGRSNLVRRAFDPCDQPGLWSDAARVFKRDCDACCSRRDLARRIFGHHLFAGGLGNHGRLTNDSNQIKKPPKISLVACSF